MHIPRVWRFWSVSLGHTTNDLFVAMDSILLAYLSVTFLPMTNTQIGQVISIAGLVGAVMLPFLGLAADQTGGRWLAALGVPWLVGFTLLALIVGVATGQYWLMAIPFVLRVLGSTAFHPVGALHAAEAEPDRVPGNMAIFFFMGQLGLALGPVVAGYLLNQSAGPDDVRVFLPFFALGLLAIPVAIFMALTIPQRATSGFRQTPGQAIRGLRESVRGLPRAGFAVLGAMIVLRGLAQPGTVAFIPLLFQQKGWSPAEYGAVTGLYWVASGVAGLVFGNVANRVDRRWVVSATLLAAAPAFFLLPLTDGLTAALMALAAGGFVGGSHSLIVVLAQEMLPGARGFASGAILGALFGAGAFGALVIGGVSDQVGLATTFQLVAGAVVIASVLALFLPVQQPSPALTPP
jgi:MFS transporter, FSR family, fosmidomycin resistance protein